MGMPSNKAECLRRIQAHQGTIASLQGFVEQTQARLKSIKGKDPQNFKAHYRHEIASLKSQIAHLKGEIAQLKTHMKTLKN